MCYDADFTPFGAERAYINTCAQNYKFEGKERDGETQNDDFGAREYTWRFGRWLSSDWSTIAVPVPYANLYNPQTLNLYSMVADDPESFADLGGHTSYDPRPGFGSESGGEGHFIWADEYVARDLGGASLNVPGWEVAAQRSSEQAQNNSQAELKGPYVADLKSKNIAPLLDPNHKPSDSDIVGNGQCVTAYSKFSGVTGDTKRWRAGVDVADNGDIKPGTAIATFDSNGRYPSGKDKNSGIYLGPGTKGSILDQWPAHSPNPAHPPQPREVLNDNARGASNNANAYHVILVAPEE